MKTVAVMTDSTCCVPSELLREHDVYVMPLLIIYRGKAYRDGVDMPVSEVYRIMRKRQEMPTTSVPSPNDFLRAYTQLGVKAQNILCITLTGRLSNTYETALLAKEMAKEAIPDVAIEVIDSRTVAGSMGFVVLAAARAATEGADLAETARVAREMIPRVSLVSMLDTLFYLARTGRTGRAAAWAASALNIKPIVEIPTTEGQTVPVERARTKRRALRRLVEIMASRVGNAPLHAMVHHADMLQDAEALRDLISAQFSCAELYITEFTPLMGVHTGPGFIGIAFYAEGESHTGEGVWNG